MARLPDDPKKPAELDYASPATRPQRLPASAFNKLDIVQISIVVLVLLALLMFVRRFLRPW